MEKHRNHLNRYSSKSQKYVNLQIKVLHTLGGFFMVELFFRLLLEYFLQMQDVRDF